MDLLVFCAIEVILLFLIGKTIKGNKVKKYNKNNIYINLKLILYSIIFIFLFYLNYKYNYKLLTIFLNIILYTLYLKYIIRFNWRKSLLLTQLLLFFYGSIYVLLLPFTFFYNISNIGNNNIKIIIILFQLLLILILKRYTIKLDKVNILNSKWNELSITSKLSLIIMILYIFINNFGCILFTGLYSFLIVEDLININIIRIILILYLIFTLIIFTTIILVLRTIKLEEYKVMLGY